MFQSVPKCMQDIKTHQCSAVKTAGPPPAVLSRLQACYGCTLCSSAYLALTKVTA